MSENTTTSNTVLDTREAAKILGISEHTLKQSRYTGKLGRQTAPTYRKIGKKVIYLQADIEAWLNSLNPLNNTCQS